MTTRSLLHIALVGFLAVTFGCGQNIFEGLTDDQTPAAKEEAARIALDNGDYDQAVTLLEGLCGTDLNNPSCSADTQQDLASSYIAQATGLDVIQLIKKADEISTSLSTGTATAEDTYTNVSSLLPITDIQDCADNPTQPCTVQENMDKAITLLENLLQTSDPANPTPEETNLYLQLAIASATDMVVAVGVLSGGLDAQGVPINVPTSLDTADQSRLVTDINNVADGVQGSGLGDEDLTQNIDDVRTELDSNTDSNVSLSELQCYVQKLQGSTCP